MISNYNKFLKEKQMRDILNLLDSILIESEGLTNRKTGAVFTNPAGQKAFFKQIAFFPVDGGAYQSPEELAQAISQIEAQLGRQIDFVGTIMKQGGFGVAEFELEDGQPLFAGKHFRQIQIPYNKNNWKNDQVPGEYRLQTKSTKKESAGYGPSDVLKNLDGQTTQSLIAQISEKFGPDSPLVMAANYVAQGKKSFVIPGDGIQFEAFRDYFCEILHPMAMASGAYDGNAKEAEKIFFRGSSFAKAAISFSASKTNGLYDSLMESGGNKIKLSSKGAGGAAASVSNLSEAVDILARSSKSQDMLNKYKKTIDIIQTIKKSSADMGPVELGAELGIINDTEAQAIIKLRDDPARYRDMEAQIQSGNKPRWMTKNLLNIWNSVGVKVPDKATPYNKLLAGLAKSVGTYLNTKTDFGDAATAILNHSALVQVDTIATQLPTGEIKLDHFQTTYPSEVVSDVAVLAGDTYMSHKVHGRFSFKIYYGKSKPSQAELAGDSDSSVSAPVDPAPASTTSDELDTVTQKRSKVTARAGGVEKLGSEKTLGRKRQGQ
jgi:hypothetical protein